MEYWILQKANGLILYPLKTSENQRFSSVSWEYKIGIFARNGKQRQEDQHILENWWYECSCGYPDDSHFIHSIPY